MVWSCPHAGDLDSYRSIAIRTPDRSCGPGGSEAGFLVELECIYILYVENVIITSRVSYNALDALETCFVFLSPGSLPIPAGHTKTARNIEAHISPLTWMSCQLFPDLICLYIPLTDDHILGSQLAISSI